MWDLRGPSRPAMGLGGYKTPVPGLYLSGSGTHPIAGINGMPGMNAAKTAIRQLAREGGGTGSRLRGGTGSRLRGGTGSGRWPSGPATASR